jgi:Tol biopolymer transport system component
LIQCTDGQRIVFHTNRDGDDYEIYSMAADGSGVTRLTERSGIDVYPEYAPDGQRVLFRRDADLWSMNPDGSDARQVTYDGGGDQMAVASPDGARIAFGTGRDGYFAVYVMSGDGSRPTNLTPLPAAADTGVVVGGSGYPAWGRDERLYISTAGPDTGGDWEIFVMNADGTGRLRLTTAPGMDASPRPF